MHKIVGEIKQSNLIHVSMYMLLLMARIFGLLEVSPRTLYNQENLLLISRTLYVPKPLIPRSQTTVQLYPLILRQYRRSYGL